MVSAEIPGSVSNVGMNRDLPRILCLHGGGSSARIFQTQCRVVVRHLSQQFHLVFADAPILSKPGPDVVPTYGDMGPFRSWIPTTGDFIPTRDIQQQLQLAMRKDDHAGYTGKWVGFLGFSQGAKIAASLLLEAQHRQVRVHPRSGVDDLWCHTWGFAVIMAGRTPLVPFCDLDGLASTLFLPTLHVQGLADRGLAYHRELYESYCDPATRHLLEWEGDHRVPIKAGDVRRLGQELKALARRAEKRILLSEQCTH